MAHVWHRQREKTWVTFLSLLLHSLIDIIKHLGNHSSKLLHHALSKVKEWLQHLLQPNALQEAGVAPRVVWIGSAFLWQFIGVVQESLLKDSVKPAAHPGDQSDAAVHQGPHLAHNSLERILNLNYIWFWFVRTLVHQDVSCLQRALSWTKASGDSLEKGFNLQHMNVMAVPVFDLYPPL